MDLVKKPKKQNSNNGFASTLKSGLETAGNVIKYTTPAYYGVVKNPMMKLWKRELIDRPDYSFYDTFNLLKIAPKSVDNWVKKQLANYIMDNNLKYSVNRLLLYKQGAKLISRNSILRFKEGRKIIKAQNGTYHGLPVLRVKDRYIVWNPSIKAYDANITIPLNGIDTKVGIGNAQGKVYRGSDNNWYQNGKMVTKFTNSSKNPFDVNNPDTWGRSIGTVTVTPKTPSYYYINGYKDRTAGLGLRSRADVINWLKRLKMGDNEIDGIWGKKTEEAYLKYLNNLLPTNALGVSSLSFLPYVEKYDIKPNEFVSAVDKKYGTPTIRSTQPTVTLYDHSGTRDWITTNLGHNPYEYTGAQRRALRYWLNGDKEGLNYDKNLLGVFGNLSQYAKQGAKLVSKNPIERFKANFIKVAQ